jgi:hypothetical protein
MTNSRDVEIKWAVHPVDEKRAAWTADDQRTTLVLLVQGNFRVDLTETSVTLSRQGDYVLWGPGIDHTWEALSDSVVVTVRWPSSVPLPRSRLMAREAKHRHRAALWCDAGVPELPSCRHLPLGGERRARGWRCPDRTGAYRRLPLDADRSPTPCRVPSAGRNRRVRSPSCGRTSALALFRSQPRRSLAAASRKACHAWTSASDTSGAATVIASVTLT